MGDIVGTEMFGWRRLSVELQNQIQKAPQAISLAELGKAISVLSGNPEGWRRTQMRREMREHARDQAGCLIAEADEAEK